MEIRNHTQKPINIMTLSLIKQESTFTNSYGTRKLETRKEDEASVMLLSRVCKCELTVGKWLQREREREREREMYGVSHKPWHCVCVCVCVREREREREHYYDVLMKWNNLQTDEVTAQPFGFPVPAHYRKNCRAFFKLPFNCEPTLCDGHSSKEIVYFIKVATGPPKDTGPAAKLGPLKLEQRIL